jgi:hypothetical protein
VWPWGFFLGRRSHPERSKFLNALSEAHEEDAQTRRRLEALPEMRSCGDESGAAHQDAGSAGRCPRDHSRTRTAHCAAAAPARHMEIDVMPFLLAARMGIFIWVTLSLMPFEIVSDWIEEEIEKRDRGEHS